MTKRKKILLIIVIAVVLLLIIGATVAYAAPEPLPGDGEGTVIDKATLYNIDSYRTYVVDKGWGWFSDFDFVKRMNDSANTVFDFNKIIYLAFKGGLDLFGGSAIVNDNVATFTAYSDSLFNYLFDNYGRTVIVAMAVYCFYLYVFKNPQRAIRQIVSFSAVLTFAFYWNANANDMVKGFDNISRELQSGLVNAGNNSQATTADNASTKIKNTLFEFAIEEPFLLMNYGVTDLNEINTMDNPKKSTELLYSGAMTEEEDKEQEKLVKNAAEDNEFLQKSKVGWKLAVSLLSIPMTVAIGTPLLVIEFMNFVLQIIALAMVAIVGIILFFSIFPRFQSVIWNTLKKILGIFGIRIMLGLSMSLIVMMINLVRSFIPSKDVASYLLQVVVIISLLVLIWKKKDTIMNFVSGGKINSVDGGIMKRISDPVKEKIGQGKDLALDAVGLATVGMPLSQMTPSKAIKDKASASYQNRQDESVNSYESSDAIVDDTMVKPNRQAAEDGEIYDAPNNANGRSKNNAAGESIIDGEFEEISSDEVIPNSLGNTYDFDNINSLTLPEASELEISEYGEIDLPEINDLEMPEYGEIDLPEINDLEMPEYGELDLPEVNGLEIPEYGKPIVESQTIEKEPSENHIETTTDNQEDVISDFSQTVSTESVFEETHLKRTVDIVEMFDNVGTENVIQIEDYTNKDVDMSKVIDFATELERLRG